VYWLFLTGSCFPNEEKKGYKMSMLFIRSKVKFERQFNNINGSFILALRNCNDFSWLFDYSYIINHLII
jgi:homogentisate 1,2-dioxygenase